MASTDAGPGLLFLQQTGPRTTLTGEERREAKRHVMKNFTARSKNPRRNARSLDQDDRPGHKPPRREVVRFRLESSHRPHQDHDLLDRFTTPTTISSNTFDPFNSLATERPGNIVSVIQYVYQPVRHHMAFLSWTHRFFDTIGQGHWDIAMGNPGMYHAVGCLGGLAPEQQSSSLCVQNFYFHRTNAYRNVRKGIQDYRASTDQPDKGTIQAISLLLYFAAREGRFDEGQTHVAALQAMAPEAVLATFSPSEWFLATFSDLNFCTANPFLAPRLPYNIHPACEWHHVLSMDLQQAASQQASQVSCLLPSALRTTTFYDLFRRQVIVAATCFEFQHYDTIMGVYYDLKYRLCLLVAQTYSGCAFHEPTAQTRRQILTPSSVSLCPLPLFSVEQERLSTATARAAHMLLVALHLSLWMLCSNQTRTQANAGVGGMITSVARFIEDASCQEVFRGCDQALLFVSATSIAYTRYALSETDADQRLRVVTREACLRCGISDSDDLQQLMDRFAGDGVWPQYAVSLVWQDVWGSDDVFFMHR